MPENRSDHEANHHGRNTCLKTAGERSAGSSRHGDRPALVLEVSEHLPETGNIIEPDLIDAGGEAD